MNKGNFLNLLRNAYHLRFLPLYLKQRRQWVRQGGKIDSEFMILSEYESEAGSTRGHYFHQDLLVANFIHKANPRRHVDIGSRIDGFVAHVASFRKIYVYDVRKLDCTHVNIQFVQCDFMNSNIQTKTDSLSCLHAIEHFGLGRYGDPLDPNGHLKGISNLIDLLEPLGKLYISFPIGSEDQVHFNAHRVFHPKSILAHPSISENMTLERFDFVNDEGELIENTDVETAVGVVKFGCGIYTFSRNTSSS